ncbi:MAG: ATP-binding protein, partial [Steroidobacteraceae bacterium]
MQDYEKLGVFYLGRELDAKSDETSDNPILYDSKDLTTHAVCVGMTGSGKTGLCLALLEEAAIDGIPAICIDPKGDLGNLMLAFPNLASDDFLPWIDPAEAQRKGASVDEYAAQTAASWKKGLADSRQPVDRVKRFRDAVDIAIYTPGSESGFPLSVLRSFAAPPAEQLADTPALRDRVGAVVSGLLGLLGRDTDPLKSREHILLATILSASWKAGRTLHIAGLIAAVQRPPFDKVGAFDLETFYPAKERLELAMAINTLLASPGFSAWMTGEPLDAQRLLFTPDGKPRIAIVSIAHLSDAERMFIVTLLLNEVIAWMRRQSGTSSLRAILYMDEIFGYFPPAANPPSKVPILTLLKQARAFGLGCVLATQNPVDLDYKGLSNAGTWFIGRLQTERDKLRVLDGLEGALSGASSFDRATLEKLMAGLTQRVFLMRNVHDDAPVLFKSRWALSYLRGPLTGLEIARLMGTHKSEARRGHDAPAATIPAAADTAFPRPNVPSDVPEYFLPATSGPESITYRPMIFGAAKLHFVDAKLDLDRWQTLGFVAPLAEDAEEPVWAEAHGAPELRERLERSPASNASFAPLPGVALRTASYATWGKRLGAHPCERARADVLVCDALKATSAPGESEGDFRARLALKAREQRDAAVDALRKKYTPKFTSLEDRERRAIERTERERSQLS